MNNLKTVVAVDLGAESGRVIAVKFDGKSLKLEELHRFSNQPVVHNGQMEWDIHALWDDVQLGIEKSKALAPATIGVDTWGVDYALLDASGELLGRPLHYRDTRTQGMMEWVTDHVPREQIFEETGIQFMPINTLYQLASQVKAADSSLTKADTFLTIPDLINFWLTGARVSEVTNASTTQMMNAGTRKWSREMLERIGIPTGILPEIIPAGTRLGSYEDIPVIAPACHDTGSAVVGTPILGHSSVYISSGTWSLVGIERNDPLINSQCLELNLTNEAGAFETIRLLKNVMGLWILQQIREEWPHRGQKYEYNDLVDAAVRAEQLKSIFNPNDAQFLSPGDHLKRINETCSATNQAVPSTVGAVTRSILESLALAYREVIDSLSQLSGDTFSEIRVVGGGSQNALLNQFTANATGIPVVAGPVEATVLGNALMQLIALGEIKDISDGRRLIAEMESWQYFEPMDRDLWDAAHEDFIAAKQFSGS